MRSMMPGMMAKNIGPSTVCVIFPTKPVAVASIRNRLRKAEMRAAERGLLEGDRYWQLCGRAGLAP